MGTVRRTKSVKAVLEMFKQCNSAVSVVTLVDRLHHQMNKTTVYRILDRLEDEGTLHSFLGQKGLKWYARFMASSDSTSPQLKSHPHFQCLDCGKISCMSVNVQIPRLPDYDIKSVELLYIGHCTNCDD